MGGSLAEGWHGDEENGGDTEQPGGAAIQA
jgi:hypothetical protein